MVIIIGIIELLLFGGAIFFLVKGKKSSSDSVLEQIEKEEKTREELYAKLKESEEGLIPFSALIDKAESADQASSSLRLERGRVTITQAELETVEARLRELDEIERELAASNVETQEELKILTKKEKDLANKNAQLKDQLLTSKTELDKILGSIQEKSEIQTKVMKCQEELLKTEVQIDDLLAQIQGGNEQYFLLKKRYDALDIEYAQLYEKFSEADS